MSNRAPAPLARWQKYELIALDEVGYVPLADVGAEFLFQVVSERVERAALIITTNLPFSEDDGISQPAIVQGVAGQNRSASGAMERGQKKR